MGSSSPPHIAIVVHGVCLLVVLALVLRPLRAIGQDNQVQATKPTQSQPSEAKGRPAQTPVESPKNTPQVREVVRSYEGQKVTSVELAGRPNLDAEQLLPLLVQQPNQPFSQAKVDQSIAALKRTGRFDDVELAVLPEADGVRVLFVLQPATYFGIYTFPGATRKFTYSRLLQVSNYPPKSAYSLTDVHNASRELDTFFRRDGYFEAEVQPEVLSNPPLGLANVVFHIQLNRRAKFGEVIIRGTTDLQTTLLQGVLRSFRARLRRSAIRPGKTYKMGTVNRATQSLTNALVDDGYLGAQVRLAGSDYSPVTNRANVIYDVKTGPVIHVRITGARLRSR